MSAPAPALGGRVKLDGLWRNRDFLRLWAGETISVFGSLIGRTALPFTAILVLDARPLQIALISAADIVPGLLVGLVAGVWVDRLPRRPIMIAADVGRALLLATVPLAYAFDALVIEQLYVVAFLTGILTIFFDVAYLSYLPSLVRKEELLEGNSKLTASFSVAEVGAFGVAGWLVQLLTAPFAVLADAVSFLFSAAFVSSIRTREPSASPGARLGGMRREVTEGLRAILKDPVLRTLGMSEVAAEFTFRMFGAVFLLFVVRGLGFHPGILGMIFAVGGVTSLMGAVSAGRVAQRLGMGPAMAYGRLGMALFMFLVVAAPHASILAALMLAGQQLGDGLYTISDINQVSLRQAIAPPHLLGRVNAGFRIAALGAMLLGTLCGGALAELAGLRVTLAAGSVGMWVAGAILLAPPVRRIRQSPAAAAPLAEAEPA